MSRHFNQKYNFTNEELVRLYIDENKTTYEIGEIKGCSWATVRYWLKKFNISLKPNHIREGVYKGQSHWDWEGGRYVKDGYVFIKDESHPKAELMKGYVREHILVMERHLGRYLNPLEVIHHKNGNRSDNRIENLELCKNQAEHNTKHRGHQGKYVSAI